MRKLPVIALGCIAGLGLPNASAHTCPLPGSPVTWATDTCLLVTHASDKQDRAVADCLRKANAWGQPCELTVLYKAKYCKALIAQARTMQTVDECVDDPDIAGPTVRQEQLLETHPVHANQPAR